MTDKKPKLLTRAEYELFLQSIPENVCTFCEWKTYQIVLKEGYKWVWIANLSPYWNWHTMLIPKRHFTEFTEMTEFELSEMGEMLKLAMVKYRGAGLKRADGSEVKKYVYFFRKRDDRFDPISGNIRPDHFHIHIAPDKDHLWDTCLDKEPYNCDINKLLD